MLDKFVKWSHRTSEGFAEEISKITTKLSPNEIVETVTKGITD